MGGLVNAVYWIFGPDELEALLKDYMLTIIHELWHKLVQGMNCVLCAGYLLKRLKTSLAILDLDNLYPLVVQLKITSNSQNHAVCNSKVVFMT
jgi:hypothetical protein